MAFTRQRTERLCIRRLVPADAAVLAAYRSLPPVARFQTAYSLETAQGLIREMAASDPTATGQWFQFGIELTAEQRLIGDIGFLNTDENGKSWIGFTLNPEYWHRGYAIEAVRAVLHYYHSLGISQVWAATDPQNEKSMRLLRVLKFETAVAAADERLFVFNY